MSQIGRYVVLKELGRGAMGVVYAASDPNIGRTVAIKTIRIHEVEDGPGRQELRDRLCREAQSAGVLSHPGIVTIFDMGEQGDDAYIVMEYVDGSTLEEIFATGVPQHSDFLLRMLKKAAEALDHAHSKGIIHRDIKPSNIMIAKDGSVKITDFGVAKISASTSMTSTGIVLGTPNYMSPEQAQAHPIDGRSDQFSLAVLAYRVLTGRLPFYAPTLTGVLSKILWSEPDFPETGLTLEVQVALLKALAKDPQLRYPTCTEFAEELERAWCSTKAEPLPVSPNQAPTPAPHAVRTVVEPANSLEQSTAEFNVRGSREAIPAPPPIAEPPPADKAPRASSAVATGSSAASVEGSGLQESGTGESSGKPRRLWGVVAVLAVAVIIAAVLLGYFYLTKEEPPPIPAQESAQLAPQKADPPQETAPVPSEAPPSESTQPPASAPAPPAPQKRARTTPTPPAELRQESRTPTPAALPAERLKPEVAKQPERKVAPASGLITWSGRLRKNSILVISARGASVGTLNGQLPGIPVTVEVDPASVDIRVPPNEQNGWKELVLSSGTEQRESITIRWTAVR